MKRYKDIGLSPEDCAAYATAEAERRVVVFESKEHADHIRELAEVENLIGKTVFYIDGGGYIESEVVRSIHIGSNKVIHLELEDGSWFTLWDDESRKLLHLTREAAEKALEEKT